MVLQYRAHYKNRPSATRDAPAGKEDLKWVPSSSTLIYGERDAVLVDTSLTIEDCKEVLDFVIARGKNLKYMYITHPHGENYFGMNVEIAEALESDEFELGGKNFQMVGHADTVYTSTLFFPSIGLAVTGDAVYYNVHPYMAETKSPALRKEWVATLNKIAELKPKLVVGGHKDPSTEDSPEAIQWTRGYFENHERLAKEKTSVEEFYEEMLELCPTALDPGSCWGAAEIMNGCVF